jgi:hypothetical protein
MEITRQKEVDGADDPAWKRHHPPERRELVRTIVSLLGTLAPRCLR